MCDLSRDEKRRIRKRDARRIKLRGICSLCGKSAETSRHHLWYSSKFLGYNVIEVCDKCDCKLHKRNENDNWIRELRAVRSLEMIRDEEYTDRYNIYVDDVCVGCAHETLTGIKLVIQDV